MLGNQSADSEVFMISDEEVVRMFRNVMQQTPVHASDAEMASRRPQIFRGVSDRQWKDAHPLGCTRQVEVFRRLNVIPKYCFDCCKILIVPRSVMELFKLLMIFEKLILPLDNTRKCMVERKNLGTYKGFVYCRGVKEANELAKIVRKSVSEDISPQVSIILKRGCTEFDHAYPGYAQIKSSGMMQYKKEWQAQEDFFEKNFTYQLGTPKADNPLVNADGLTNLYTAWEIACMQYWLSYAATIGDISYLAISGMSVPKIPNLKRPPFRNNTILAKKPK